MATKRKTGGRQKGTPNIATQLGKSAISELLADYSSSGLMASDFAQLTPRDRLLIAERLMQYTIPKMQATTVDLNTPDDTRTIEETLAELARED